MAITTLAQVTSGMRPTIHVSKSTGSLTNNSPQFMTNWYEDGYPPPATAYAGGMSGAAITSATGALPFSNPTSGNTHLTGFFNSLNINIADSSQRSVMLVDRLWHNSGINVTLTTAQTINSVAWPARDLDASTNGNGVFIALELSTACGAGTPTISMSYTNSAGTSGRTGTSAYPTRTNAPRGHWFLMGLQEGDVGVRSVQTITLSATWTSGTVHLVAFRPIALIGMGGRKGKFNAEDALTLGMPQLWNNSVPQILAIATSGTTNSGGFYNVTFSQG